LLKDVVVCNQIRDRKRWLCSASKIDRHRAGAVVPSMFPSGNGWDLSDLEFLTEVSSPPTGKCFVCMMVLGWISCVLCSDLERFIDLNLFKN